LKNVVPRSANNLLKYSSLPYAAMTSEKSEITKSDKERARQILRRPLDEIFDSFRKDMEYAFATSWWPRTWDWRLPSLASEIDVRMPLCDMVDKGDRYEVSLEIPGIPKEKIDIKATKVKLEVSGQQEKKSEDKGKNYVYNERSYQSFSRRIPVPEEIIPSKVDAKMENGILRIEIPKKTPTKVEEEQTKVEVK
jgi:HSP20 family protein